MAYSQQTKKTPPLRDLAINRPGNRDRNADLKTKT